MRDFGKLCWLALKELSRSDDRHNPHMGLMKPLMLAISLYCLAEEYYLGRPFSLIGLVIVGLVLTDYLLIMRRLAKMRRQNPTA